MLKRVVSVLALLAFLFLPSALYAQHAGHHPMTEDDYRALAVSLSKHGDVIPQPPATVEPTASVSFTITAHAVSTNSAQFTVSPSPFTVNQGDTVNITFTVPSNDFSTSHGILMDTYIESARNCNRGNSISISFVATTAGTFSYVCSVPSCSNAHSNMVGTMTVTPVTQPPPSVSSVNPSTGPVAGGTSVTVNGSGFANNATVSFGGTAATNVQVTSGTAISCKTPAHGAGQVAVAVTNPDAQSGVLANGFTYQNPTPAITSLDPAGGSTAGGTVVTIHGTNFVSGATVTFGGTPATGVTFGASTSLTATAPAHAAGNAAVVVTNPDSQNATFNSFTYTAPVLAIAGIEPSAGPPAGGNVIEIIGSGFGSTPSVTVGGVAATNVQVIDAVTLKATVPAHAAGAVDVAVTAGSTTVTAVRGYVYAPPPSKRRGVAH